MCKRQVVGVTDPNIHLKFQVIGGEDLEQRETWKTDDKGNKKFKIHRHIVTMALGFIGKSFSSAAEAMGTKIDASIFDGNTIQQRKQFAASKFEKTTDFSIAATQAAKGYLVVGTCWSGAHVFTFIRDGKINNIGSARAAPNNNIILPKYSGFDSQKDQQMITIKF